MTEQNQTSRWQKASKGQVHELVFTHVQKLEQEQSDLYDRFVKLEALYDPNGAAASYTDMRSDMMGVCENTIASNVDTVTAVVAATEVRSRFMTDGASWSEQRRAKGCEYYVEGIGKLTDRTAKCRLAFTGAAKKGTGFVKVYADGFDEVCVDHVIADDIVIDPRHRAKPREMHQRHVCDRDELIDEYPKYEQQIRDAHGRATGGLWAGYRPIGEDELVMLESWQKPHGTKGHKNYRPGRHTKTIECATILDEEWHECFPIARIAWTERDDAYHGIGGAERIMGTQRALNRRNVQIERQLDQGAFPTTYVRQSDAALAVKATNRIGTIAVYKADKPETVIAPAVSGETYQSRVDLKESANNEFGHSSMATHGMTPAGLETGAAVREFKSFTTQRFATQEKAFEQLCLDVDLLLLGLCKKLAAKNAAPVVLRDTRWGPRKLTWSKVDLGELKVQIAAASTLPRTPAGRQQTALEWAQAGVISMDVFRRLVDHPDLEKEWSLFASAIEAIEEQFEVIADGEIVMPEPFDNLKMAAFRGQQTYLMWRSRGAPERALEGLRQYIVQAIYVDKLKSSGAQNGNMGAIDGGAGAPGADGAPVDPSMVTPELQAGMPPADPVMAALAPEAMNLRAV